MTPVDKMVRAARRSKFAKQMLEGEIDAMVTRMTAHWKMPAFREQPLDVRITALALAAECSGVPKVATACNDWMRIIEA